MRLGLLLLVAACSPPRQAAPASVPSSRPPSAPSSCSDPRIKEHMLQQLYREQEFREFTCDEAPCDVAVFAQALGFEQKVLRDRPPLLGCFVVPGGWRLRNMFALFTLDDGQLRYQLSYLGNSLDPDQPRPDGRPRDLIGRHKLDAATWITERFVWSAQGYSWQGEEPETP